MALSGNTAPRQVIAVARYILSGKVFKQSYHITLPLQALQPPVGTLLLVAVAAQPEAKGHNLSLPPGKKVPDDRR